MTTTPWRRLVAALATATILPFALSACGGDDTSDDKSSNSSSDNDNKDDKGDNDSAEDDAAEDAIDDAIDGSGDVDVETGGDLPDDFPESIPLVGDVQGGAAVDTGQGKGWSVSTSYDGSVDDALAEASDALTGAGFEDQSGGAIPNGGSFISSEYGVILAVVESGGETVIGYTVAPNLG